jgi:hypothetical protein
MISPTDIFHPPPAPHFKTFQVFLIYCPKRFQVIPQRKYFREMCDRLLKYPETPVGTSHFVRPFFYWSRPDVFSLSIPRVSSVETQLICGQLKWRYVSTQ